VDRSAELWNPYWGKSEKGCTGEEKFLYEGWSLLFEVLKEKHKISFQ